MKKNKVCVVLIVSAVLMFGSHFLGNQIVEASQTDLSVRLTKNIAANDLPGFENSSGKIEVAKQDQSISKKLPRTGIEDGRLPYPYIGITLLLIASMIKLVERRRIKEKER